MKHLSLLRNSFRALRLCEYFAIEHTITKKVLMMIYKEFNTRFDKTIIYGPNLQK